MVLEARDRVGGHVLNLDLGNGAVTEGGGTFVGPTQHHVLALADALGIACSTPWQLDTSTDGIATSIGATTTADD